MIDTYIIKFIEKILAAIVLLGGIAWALIGLFKFNIITWAAKKTFTSAEPIIYIIVGLAAIYFLFSRDFYLPFLGETIFPCEPLAEKIPDNYDTTKTIKVEPNSNVIFWASESEKDDVVDNPWKAYSKYSNSGITRSNNNGIAVLKVRKPISYKIPSGRTLETHIHYRVCKKNGILGRVETTYL
jgi:uncharacterized membrane protein YuzA (DUF378 family)